MDNLSNTIDRLSNTIEPSAFYALINTLQNCQTETCINVLIKLESQSQTKKKNIILSPMTAFETYKMC